MTPQSRSSHCVLNAIHPDFEMPKSEIETISPSVKPRLVKLIGDKCIVTCCLDKIPVQALRDTGAQCPLSLVSFFMPCVQALTCDL